MSKAVVTGAAGRIGGSVASTLRRLGHRVVGVDLRPPPEDSAACDVFVACDLAAAADPSTSSHGALVDACAGATVVVHCAAWPGPSAHPPPAVDASGAAADPGIGLEPCSPAILLRDNVGATSAVCDAAIRGGASRVVFSSSAFALGFSHAAAGPQAYAPKCARGHATPICTAARAAHRKRTRFRRYLPIDEAHGALPHETYGLSKLAGEEVRRRPPPPSKKAREASRNLARVVELRWAAVPTLIF